MVADACIEALECKSGRYCPNDVKYIHRLLDVRKFSLPGEVLAIFSQFICFEFKFPTRFTSHYILTEAICYVPVAYWSWYNQLASSSRVLCLMPIVARKVFQGGELAETLTRLVNWLAIFLVFMFGVQIPPIFTMPSILSGSFNSVPITYWVLWNQLTRTPNFRSFCIGWKTILFLYVCVYVRASLQFSS